MVKAHSPIDWQNYPSVSTPLNETNLRKMDNAIGVLDDRIIVLDTTKASQADMLTAFSGIAFDKETGILILYRKNGATEVIDTGLSKVTVNLDFDDNTQQFILYLADGTEKRIDVSALITQNEFVESDTVYWTLSADGKVKADIKKGSITGDMLEPNYLANVQLWASQAINYAGQASNFAYQAKTSADKAESLNMQTETVLDEAKETLAEINKKVTETTFHVNLETGKLEYDSPNYNFTVDNSTGKLKWEVA